MTPVNFKEANDVLKAPKGQEDQVQDLPIFRCSQEIKGLVMPLTISAWKPSEEEIRLISEGGLIYFRCFGKTHPPISIGAFPLIILEANSWLADNNNLRIL